MCFNSLCLYLCDPTLCSNYSNVIFKTKVPSNIYDFLTFCKLFETTSMCELFIILRLNVKYQSCRSRGIRLQTPNKSYC